MRFSVIPSVRYSVRSPPTFTKGKTARESMGLSCPNHKLPRH
jgi:hypothetical protein